MTSLTDTVTALISRDISPDIFASVLKQTPGLLRGKRPSDPLSDVIDASKIEAWGPGDTVAFGNEVYTDVSVAFYDLREALLDRGCERVRGLRPDTDRERRSELAGWLRLNEQRRQHGLPEFQVPIGLLTEPPPVDVTGWLAKLPVKKRGRPRGSAKGAKAVALKEADPTLGDKQIARRVGLNHRTVRRHRAAKNSH